MLGREKTKRGQEGNGSEKWRTVGIERGERERERERKGEGPRKDRIGLLNFFNGLKKLVHKYRVDKWYTGQTDL